MKEAILGILLGAHKLSLNGDMRGVRLNLAYADLTYAYLTGSDLAYAKLAYANLTGSDLAYANLAHADLAHADLTHADLAHADLTGTNLAHANLTGTNLTNTRIKNITQGNNQEIITLQLGYEWQIVMTKDVMAIGCQQHEVVDWWKFTKKQIQKMDSDALEFWALNKPILKRIHKNLFGEKS